MGGEGFIYTTNSTSFAATTHHNSGHDNNIFGPVPSRVEIERAIFDLQRFMNGISSTSKPKLDGLHGVLYNHHHIRQPRMVQTPAGFDTFCGAFSMMQTEPAFQNMVVSISSDKALWDAIVINKAVQDIQGSIAAGFSSLNTMDQTEGKENKQLSYYSEEPDISILILKWVIGFTKSKVSELVDKFGFLVNEILKPSAPKDKPTSELTDLLEEKVRSSLLLSVVIILIVVVTRSNV